MRVGHPRNQLKREDEIGTAIEDDLETIRDSRTENDIWNYETDDRTATWSVIPWNRNGFSLD